MSRRFCMLLGAQAYSEVVDAPEYDLVDAQGYEFLFQKELRASDVSSLGRIVLPKVVPSFQFLP